MKLIFIISMLLFVMLGFSVQAAEECEPSAVNAQNTMQKVAPGKITCYGKACYYIPQKSSTNTLIREVRKSVTGSLSNLFSPRDGYVGGGRDRGEMSFWHRCQNILDEMKLRVVQLDTPILSTGRRRIQFVVKIYHITSQTMNNFSFGLTGLYDGLIETAPAKGNLSSSNGAFDLSFAFGNLTNDMLNVNLTRSKNTSHAHELRDVPFELLEGEDINRSLIKKNIFEDSGIGDPIIEETGYRLSGRAYVDETGEEPVVVVKDFGVMYSVPQPENESVLSEVLDIHRWEVTIPRGRPYILNADNISISSSEKGRALPFYLEDSKIRVNSKLMIFISAWPADSPPPEEPNKISLTEDEVRALPATSNIDLLKTAEFSVKSTGGAAEFDLVQFSLDREALSAANYKEDVRITMEGPDGQKNTRLVEAQHLATGAFQMPSMFGVNDTAEVEIKLWLKWADKAPSGQKSGKYKLRHRQRLKKVKVISRR